MNMVALVKYAAFVHTLFTASISAIYPSTPQSLPEALQIEIHRLNTFEHTFQAQLPALVTPVAIIIMAAMYHFKIEFVLPSTFPLPM